MSGDPSLPAPGRVAVVTDSTADFPPHVQPAQLTTVPLAVQVEGRWAPENEVTPAVLSRALRTGRSVTTSRPTPQAFAQAYRNAFDAGATHVVSIHLSGVLSGTCASARLGAQQFADGAVRVVDSRSTVMGLGFAVLAASAAAAAGARPDEVGATAQAAAAATSCLFYVDSMEYLRRGGRMGTAQALLATALSVKALLHVHEGRIVPLEKVRTSARAIARLVELALDRAGTDAVDVAVQHLDAPERAAAVVAALTDRLPGARSIVTGEIGAVVGAHTGPGTVGIVVLRRSPASPDSLAH